MQWLQGHEQVMVFLFRVSLSRWRRPPSGSFSFNQTFLVLHSRDSTCVSSVAAALCCALCLRLASGPFFFNYSIRFFEAMPSECSYRGFIFGLVILALLRRNCAPRTPVLCAGQRRSQSTLVLLYIALWLLQLCCLARRLASVLLCSFLFNINGNSSICAQDLISGTNNGWQTGCRICRDRSEAMICPDHDKCHGPGINNSAGKGKGTCAHQPLL